MSDTDMRRKSAAETSRGGTVEMKLEVVVIPVSDVDRAKRFYSDLGWRLDLDYKAAGDDFRMIQFTPPGSACSIAFGWNMTAAVPGSVQELLLVVSDIEAARDDLLRRGIEISEPFHDAGGVFHHAGMRGRVDGPNPDRKSYASYASFSDPDGNGWLFQEVTTRLTGQLEAGDTSFTGELANAVRRGTAG
jgi:catechol 2,3-dioxygenase-like lactoylglutathione lyase family enzyme